LGLTADRTSFVFIRERAEIVKEIFKMSAAGLGGYTIAKKLNAAGLPGFGPSGRWDQSTIHLMLSNRATVGEYQKKRRVQGREVKIGPPIPNYYPSVIDESLFEAARLARIGNLAERRGRKGRHIANLFAGIAHCWYCGAAIRFLSRGKYKYLVCSAVSGPLGCHRFRWTYADFEGSFLSLARNNLSPKLVTSIGSEDGFVEQPTLYAARVELMLELRRTVTSLRIAAAGSSPPPTDESVYRDHAARFFEVSFKNKAQQVGRAHARDVPPMPLHPTLEPAKVKELLNISPRQAELVALLASGLTLKQAGERLNMELTTTRWHLRMVFAKTGTHSQAEVVGLVRAS